jgi:hypothetical protein
MQNYSTTVLFPDYLLSFRFLSPPKNRKEVSLMLAGKGNEVFLTPPQGRAASRFRGKSSPFASLRVVFSSKAFRQ